MLFRSHNAAFTALGLDWVYVAFPVAAGQGPAAVDAMRALELAGLSVTMPHKSDVAGAVDRLAPDRIRGPHGRGVQRGVKPRRRADCDGQRR